MPKRKPLLSQKETEKLCRCYVDNSAEVNEYMGTHCTTCGREKIERSYTTKMYCKWCGRRIGKSFYECPKAGAFFTFRYHDSYPLRQYPL